MSSSFSDRYYETVLLPQTPEDPHFVDGCVPDLRFLRFRDLNLDQLASLGVDHVLVDVDGTLIPKSAISIKIDSPTALKLNEIAEDDRFTSLSIATENGSQPENLTRLLGFASTSAIFQPWEAGTLGTSWKTTDRFWKKILFELDCFDEPNRVVMIGDSLARDIQPAQKQGLKTVLVNRLVRRPRIDI